MHSLHSQLLPQCAARLVSRVTATMHIKAAAYVQSHTAESKKQNVSDTSRPPRNSKLLQCFVRLHIACICLQLLQHATSTAGCGHLLHVSKFVKLCGQRDTNTQAGPSSFLPLKIEAGTSRLGENRRLENHCQRAGNIKHATLSLQTVNKAQ